MPSSRRVTLVSPPLWAAIHGPPLALPSLGAYLRQEGFPVRLLDLNIRMINDARLFDLAIEAAQARVEAFNAREDLDDAERAGYEGLLRLLIRWAHGPPAGAGAEGRLDFYLEYFEPLWQEGILIPELDRIARVDPRCVYRRRFEETADEWIDPADLAVGISVACAEQLLGAFSLAQTLKRAAPRVPVILGGSVFSLLDPGTLRQVAALPYVDYLVRQEGEIPLARLCRALAGDGDPGSAPNVVFRSGGSFTETPVAEPEPPERLPLPDFQDLLRKGYAEPVQLPVLQNKGCYWGKCTFCDIHLYVSGSRRYRQDDPGRLALRILELRTIHDHREFEIVTTAMSPAYARQFSGALTAAGGGVTWETRIKYEDQFDEELFGVMARAGCRRISIGVESLSERVIRLIDKGDYDRVKIERLLGAAKRAGIAGTKIWLIPNYPTTTREEAEEIGVFLRESRDLLDVVHIFGFHALEHTPIVREPERFGIRLTGVRERSVFGLHAVRYETTQGMSREEGVEMVARLRRAWEEISAGPGRPEPDVDAAALLTGWWRVRGPVRVLPTRHARRVPEIPVLKPEPPRLLVSPSAGATFLAGPLDERLVRAFDGRGPFGLTDAVDEVRRTGVLAPERLVAGVFDSLANLAKAGLLTAGAESPSPALPVRSETCR